MSGQSLKRTTISTYTVETPLEIEFIYHEVKTFRHQLEDYSFSFHTSFTHKHKTPHKTLHIDRRKCAIKYTMK